MNTNDISLKLDPIEQFLIWFQEAQNSKEAQPEAMTLATCDKEGKPCARIVLYKGMKANGFLFYTNYQSPKGKELEKNPNACLVFHWPVLNRQLRIDGFVEKISPQESNQYFQSRPRQNQIGAWASPQSQTLEHRKILDDQYEKLSQEYQGKTIPCPPHWGGYVLFPKRMEFWIGQEKRLHDRFCYYQSPEGWKIQRLAP